MTDLDVALKLRLINLLSKPAKAAAKDLAGIKTAADRLHAGKGAGELARELATVKTVASKLGSGKVTGLFVGELGKAWTASAKLGDTLGNVETKARGAATSLRRFALDKSLLGAMQREAADKQRAGKGAGDLARELAKVKTAADKLGSGKATGRFTSDLSKACTASARLGDMLGKVEVKARGAAAATRHFAIDTSQFVAMRREVERLLAAYKKLADQQRRTQKPPRQPPSSPDRKSKRQDRKAMLDEALSRMGGNAYLLGAGRMTMAGAAIGGGAAAAIGGGYAATRTAISFEKAMADVKKKVTLDPGATWADVEATINQVSRDLGIAREDTAALTATAGQAGIAYKDLAEFVRLAAKTASAWDIAPKDASERLAKIKAQTQWSNEELEAFADKVNALGDASASAEKDIAEMFQRAAGSAKAAGVDFDTSLGITTALNSIGMAEETASRFFNAFSSKLRTASDQPDKAAEGYKMLGKTVEEVEKGMKRDAAGTILDILDRLEKHPDKAKIAVKLFGQEWWDEAARAGQALPEIRKNLELLHSGKWKGSLKQNLQIDLDTTNNKLQRAKQLVSEIGDRLGRWALPSINSALENILKKYDQVEEKRKRAEAAQKAGDNAAAGLPQTSEDSQHMREDPAYLEEVENARKNSDQGPEKLEEHIRELEQLRAKLAELEANFNSDAGMGFDGTAQLRNQIEARIATLQSLIEAAKALPDNPPQPPKRPADLYDGKDVDALIGKLQELDRVSRTLKLFPDDETAKSRARELVADLTKTFQSADLSPAAKKVIDTYVAGLASEGGKASAEAQKIRAQLEKILGAPIVVKITPSLSGAPGDAGGPKAGAAKGKKSSLNGAGGNVSIQHAHFHGVRDLAGAHRQALAMADRAARSKRDAALHDTDVGDTA